MNRVVMLVGILSSVNIGRNHIGTAVILSSMCKNYEPCHDLLQSPSSIRYSQSQGWSHRMEGQNVPNKRLAAQKPREPQYRQIYQRGEDRRGNQSHGKVYRKSRNNR